MSLLVPSDPAAPAEVVLLHPVGPYARAVTLAEPIRWMRRGRRICFASGSSVAACGEASGSLRVSQRVALGAGWRTRLRGCAPFTVRHQAPWTPIVGGVLTAGALLALARRRGRRRGLLLLAPSAGLVLLSGLAPWALDPRLDLLAIGVCVALAASMAALALRGGARHRLAVAGCAALVAAWGVLVPHPVRVAGSSRALPGTTGEAELWVDPALWNPVAPHQALATREEPLAALDDDGPETWWVVGGSVAYGVEVDPAHTFTAQAERRLRAAGHRVRLRNAAAPAWNLGQIDTFLRGLGDRLPVRGIVVASVLNNAGFSLHGPRPRGCEHTLAGATACALWRSPLHLAWLKYFLPKPGNLDRIRRTLGELIERERSLGRSVILLDETSRWQIGRHLRDGRDEAVRTALREVAAHRGLRLHPVADAVAAVPPDDRLLDAIHLAPAGHAAVGTRLAAILAPRVGEGR
ncbi:MAG: SGNH/GDSL hydrolase family protein [Myxococcota bacterium]